MQLSLQQLFSQALPGSVIITPNQRLAYFLESAASSACTASILTLNTWLNKIWQTTGQQTRVLSDYQALLIWQHIISESSYSQQLLQYQQTAKIAYQAWQLCQRWQLDYHTQPFTESMESKAFQQWAKQFQQHCHEFNYLDTSSLATHLPKYLTTQQSKQIIYLVGFLEYPPQLQFFLQKLSEQFHWQITQVELITETKTCQHIICHDQQQEIDYMTRWVAQLLQQNIAGPITCIVPNLTELRDTLLHAFTTQLTPSIFIQGQIVNTPPFDLPLGLNLTQYPMIDAALNSLLCLSHTIEISICNALLKSIFSLGGESEYAPRALFANYLHEIGIANISRADWLTIIPANCPIFRHSLLQISQLHCNKTALPSYWRNVFQQVLDYLGWPGERRLNSTEYQLLNRWQILLDEFASLDPFLSELSCSAAITQLKQLTNASLFQAENPQPKVFVLTPLESLGMIASHSWIMSLQDNTTARPFKPNPFLSIALQRQQGLPQANYGREYELTLQLLKQLQHSAAQIIISSAQFSDEQTLRPHTYLTSIPLCTTQALNLPNYATFTEQLFATRVLEYYQDIAGPALLPRQVVRGGSSIFKAQAACAFRAFALYRYNVRPASNYNPGLTPLERGIILHRALQQLWQQIGDQQTLLNYSETEFADLLQSAIATSHYALPKLRLKQLGLKFLQLEQRRLASILSNWFTVERARSPFRVLAAEESLTTEFAGIPLQLKWDRLDLLADGRQLLIDYKTSKIDINKWQGERPDEPQLPLYALLNPSSISGIAFAEINAKNSKLLGCIAASTDYVSLPELRHINDWPAQLAHWQMILDKLANEFKCGSAQVNPKYGQQTCRDCGLQSLCRVEK